MGEATRFEKLGLTQYESAILAVLSTTKKEMNALEISEKANVPYTKIYLVLGALEKQGIVNVLEERPKKYCSVKPKIIFENFFRKKEQELEYLKERSMQDLLEMQVQ